MQILGVTSVYWESRKSSSTLGRRKAEAGRAEYLPRPGGLQLRVELMGAVGFSSRITHAAGPPRPRLGEQTNIWGAGRPN